MKKVLLLALALSLCGCAKKVTPPPPPPPPPIDFAVTIKFGYDFTNFFACSATVTKGCITGFSWGYLQGTTQVPLHTATVSACTGSAQPQSCSDTTNTQLPIGSLTFYAKANYIDNNGVSGSTQPSTTATPSQVPADAPTNVTESHQ